MSIFKVLESKVNKCSEIYKDYLPFKNNQILRGAEFMMYSLVNIFHDKNIEEIENGIVDSSYREVSNDYGIDAIYITASKEFVEDVSQLEDYNRDTKFVVHIFQFKRGTGVSQEDLLKLKNGIDKIFINNEIDDEYNIYLFDRITNLKNILDKIYEDYRIENIEVICNFVFGGIKETVEKNNIVMTEVDSITSLLKSEGHINTRFIITDCTDLIDNQYKKKNIDDIVEYQQTFKYITDEVKDNKLNGYICMIKGVNVANLVRKHQASIFEANIRDYYKKIDLNSKILETSSNEDAKYFWSYNNGLTMTCSKVDELPNNKYRLHNLQIVNGCQTSNAIYYAMQNKERVEELQSKEEVEGLTPQERKELVEKMPLQFNNNTSVLVKIIETEDDDLIYKITETTNSQTPIKTFSLKANDDIQKLIEVYLEDNNISYERRINELRNKGRKNIYSIQKLFQLYTSHVLIKPSQVKTRPKSMFVNTYDKVFPSPNRVTRDFSLYLIPILVDLAINDAIKNNLAKFKENNYKRTMVSYGRFHIGCFILSSILKKDYNQEGIVSNKDSIIKELNENIEDHFENAIFEFDKILKSFAGNKMESIPSAVKKQDLDIRIRKFIEGRK
ncbi:AIPR family protein [uncultured Psychrobacter sp.]|uniref:AIPR family protein n=1 Tax=uncultured Psychrobacter sp. TaxID=259303 RepID=UPI00260FD490|nr:AIPR family protein [uncultured Psychrobacter sp.]